MKENELKKHAMGIVNQLFDLAEVPLEKRQAINDKSDEYVIEQLRLCVGNSSDLIVVELSDDEIKIISEQELKEWQQSAIEFDGFEGWIVRGRLVK